MPAQSKQNATAGSILNVVLFTFVDVLGFSLVLPLLPYLASHSSLSMSARVVGLSSTANALTQMLAAPVIGALSDRHGRRPLLLTCVAGTLFSFALMAYAISVGSVWLLMLSRVLDGALGGNISLAQAYITDCTSKSDRAKYLGLTMAAYGLGFTVGPALGGVLIARFGSSNLAIAPVAAALLTAVNMLGVYLFVPESHRPTASARRASAPSFATGVLVQHFANAQLRPLLAARFLTHFVFTMVIEASFGYYCKDVLRLPASSSQYMLAMVGVVYSLAQGGIRRLTNRYDDEHVTVATFALSAVALLVLHNASTVRLAAFCLAVYALGTGINNTLVYSLISKCVPADAVGGAMGVTAAVMSITRVTAPAAAGEILHVLGPQAVSFCGGLLLVLVWMFAPVFVFGGAVRHDGKRRQ